MFSRIAAERIVAGALLAGALVSTSSTARAQAPVAAPAPQDAALAQSLFDDARQLMIANRFAEACPKLAESERLDPALGTLLNLAVCNERLGRTASAWAEYRDAESVAKREGRGERESYAHAHAVALEPRLSRLVIVRARENGDRGLEVRLDGATMGEAAFGSGVPVDPGGHRVEVRAPEKKPWSTTVTVDDYADKKSVEIPTLEDAAPPPEPASVVRGMTEGGPLAITLPSVPPPEEKVQARSHSRRPARAAAYVVGGVGVAALAIGAVAGMQAVVKWNDRAKLCTGDSCVEAGVGADSAARSWARASDVALGVGALGVGVAAYLFFTSREGSVHVAPMASARAAGLGLDCAW